MNFNIPEKNMDFLIEIKLLQTKQFRALWKKFAYTQFRIEQILNR